MKVSVVVPIYNVEMYLRKCIDSIIGQTYKDLEIILVDDGSTDSCPQICDEYALIDNRIRVIHKKNGGLSSARNAALEVMTGDYVLCVDSDDYIDLDMIDYQIKLAEANNADIVSIFYDKVYEDTVLVSKEKESTVKVLEKEKALELLLYHKKCTNSAWGKLYKANLFDGIRYPFGKICEDLPTTYRLFAKSNIIVISDAQKYHYLMRNNSIIKSKFKPSRFDALQFARDETVFIEENFPKIRKAAINREFMESVFLLMVIDPDDENNEIFLSESSKIYKKYKWTVLTDFKATLKSKFFALIGCNNIYKFNNR